MNILIQGTPSFNDYNVFLRAMRVTLSDMKDGDINLYSLGPLHVSNHAQEFVNKTEDSLLSRNIRIKYYRAHADQLPQIKPDQMLFFCNKGQHLSRLGQQLSDDGLDVLVFRY